MISDMLKKGMLTSIGMAVIAKDAVEEIGKKIIGKGEMSEDEGRKFFEDISRASEKTRMEFEDRVREMIREALSKLDIASKKELEALRERVSQLEAERGERGGAYRDMGKMGGEDHAAETASSGESEKLHTEAGPEPQVVSPAEEAAAAEDELDDEVR